jgi:hypothetical protein
VTEGVADDFSAFPRGTSTRNQREEKWLGDAVNSCGDAQQGDPGGVLRSCSSKVTECERPHLAGSL